MSRFPTDVEIDRLKRECDMRADDNLKLCKKIDGLRAENERLRKLCPSLVELDTNEALHPESTITVAVGYLHTLLEAKERLEQCRWHRVADRLPDEDRYVLVHLGTECPETAWYDGVFWGMEEGDTDTHELTAVTHWREIGPLPEAGTGDGFPLPDAIPVRPGPGQAMDINRLTSKGLVAISVTRV